MEPFFSDNKEKEEENQFIHAMELIGGSVLPVVLKALIELQVLDILAEAGLGAQLSPSEILSRLPPSATLCSNPNAPEMLDRMLCFLVSHSILTCSVVSSNQASLPASLVRPRRLYGLAPVAKYLVNNQDGCSLAPLLFFSQDKVFMDGWDGLKGAVLEGGIPFARVHGMQLFEYPGKDPRFNEVFNKAMLNVTTIIVKRILNSYKGFEQLQNLVDVAGGLGVTLHLITSKYPHIKAINFDLPHVIKHAPPYPGVEHVGGDMFESVPKGDAIFLKYILHDWSDDQCLKLLKNCHKALPDNGKVIVAEGILPVIPDRSDATKYLCRMDVFIMAGLGGKERTQQEFMALAIGAGFSGIKFECYACNLWVMEFYK